MTDSEDIERSGRDTFNALKLERELGDNGILLFAADEPIDLDGTDPATILLRRTKQNIAEYFRLSLKQKMWRGLRTHAAQGYNLGKVLDGYLPEKIPHPAPVQSLPGPHQNPPGPGRAARPHHRRHLSDAGGGKLGVPAIHARLAADPGTYPPADPEIGWTIGGIYSILANPKYTGYQVFGRTRKGKPVPPGQWYWPDQRTHPAIVDREVWQAAQKGPAPSTAAHATAPPTTRPTGAATRSGPRVRCKICKRRMCGIPKRHPHNKTPTEYFYYVCQYNPNTPSHVAAAPDHPRTVQVREDVLMAETFRGLSAYALAPGREQRLAELIPHTATARQAQHDRQAAALAKRLKRLTARQDNLMRELNGSFDMPDEAGEAYRRRIRADYANPAHRT